jgi:hypothetical protein
LEELPEEADNEKESLLRKAKSFFSNSEHVWPLHYPTFFLGHVPILTKDINPSHFSSNRKYQQFIRDIHADFHIAGIRLAGRIMGELLREMAKRRDEEMKS